MILGTHLFRFGKQIAVLFIRKLHTSIDELARGLHQVRMPLGLCLTPYRQNVVVEQRLDVLDVPRFYLVVPKPVFRATCVVVVEQRLGVLDVPRFYLGVPQPVFRGRLLIRRRAPGAKATSDFRHPYFPFTVTNDIPFSSLLIFFPHMYACGSANRGADRRVTSICYFLF